ncbi:hypothetical protein [Catellatospora sp. NPDC049609]|uniref:hypothetical protein n=1 Tax=Catellatospora sp. NPDC049609 TaxID=3155505 RepID=UPI00343785BC
MRRRLWSAARDALRSSPQDAYAIGLAQAAFRDAARPDAIATLLAAAQEADDAGRPELAAALYRQAAEAGDHRAVVRLVNRPGIREDRAAMEAVYRGAVAAGDVRSLAGLANVRARQGDPAEARKLYVRAVAAGDVAALTAYAAFLRNHGEPGEHERAIQAHRQRVDRGDAGALAVLGALLLAVPGGRAEAEAVLRRGAAVLDDRSRCLLAALLLNEGAVRVATELVERVRATGDELARAYADRLADEYELPVDPR